MSIRFVAIAVGVFGCTSTAVEEPSPMPESGIREATWVTPGGMRLRYTISVPSMAVGDRVPLIIALHGRPASDTVPHFYGGRGLRLLFQPALEPLGAIIVAPDAPSNNWTAPGAEQAVLDLLNELMVRYPIDPQRTMLTGFSMGGMGTWFIVGKHPMRFRVALPIASFPLVRPTAITRRGLTDAYAEMDADSTYAWALPYREIPIYVIHSREDDSVPFAADSLLSTRVKAVGADVEFVPVDGLKHSPVDEYQMALSAAIPWINRQWARP